ncbi:TMV resistance protein N-like [Hibiscus syriacus]|uniref:TMV resistance protein N-like n=1 Tax=Hibiscus syriacus TaxID=106335 RepID=A0A6A2XSX1_HIBSY|nr:TMV resistance protein N-like [Hibiscus syriacus]
MGVSFSFPFAKCSDVENGLESITVKSISFGDDGVRTPVRSISFKGSDSEPTILKSLGSGKMILEGSISFKGRDFERIISFKSPSSDEAVDSKSKAIDIQSPKPDSLAENPKPQPVLDPDVPQHEAAIRLQKVYKSFRTRRKLADCAVLVEQSWRKLADCAVLVEQSWCVLYLNVLYYLSIDKHETAILRWSRARTRAAKVGKGLSKNDKAQKLALRHWLEAIDPRHRYGHNLDFYYNQWRHSQSQEPFFYWLDIGEGKEVNLEKCSRSKLQQQCIKYLGPETGKVLHTTKENGNAKWIFVLSTSKILYVGVKKKGTFQHSSFLAGGATVTAGRLAVDSGVLKAVWPHSGHYRPTPQNFNDFISFLRENNVDLTDVKMTPVDEEETLVSKQSSNHLRSNSSEEDFVLEAEEINVKDSIKEVGDSREQETGAALEHPKPRRLLSLRRKLTNLEILKRTELFEMSKGDYTVVLPSCSNNLMDSDLEDGYETKRKSLLLNKRPMNIMWIITRWKTFPKNRFLKGLTLKKGMNSYQLGKQLSCKWTTGAGPWFGCVRDYPSELQFRALEQVSLSPSSSGNPKLYFSPRPASSLSPKVPTPADPWLESAPAFTKLFTQTENATLKNDDSILKTGEDLPVVSAPTVPPALAINPITESVIKKSEEKMSNLSLKSDCEDVGAEQERKSWRKYRDFRRFKFGIGESCTYTVVHAGGWHSGINARRPRNTPMSGGNPKLTPSIRDEEINDTIPTLGSDMNFRKGKYLYYARGGDYCKGMNHYLWTLLCGLGEAMYLNRTFVMLDLSICLSASYNPSNKDEEGKDFRYYFDFEHLKVVASVVEESEFLRAWKKWNRGHKRKVPVKKVTSYKVTPMQLKAKNKSTIIWRQFDSPEPENYWYRGRRHKTKNSGHTWIRVHPPMLLTKLKEMVQPWTNLYIATNEPFYNYFDKLRSQYKVHLLDDYKELWSNTSEWYNGTTQLNDGKPVEFDGYMRVAVDTEVLYRAKTRVETFYNLTKDCKDGINTC